MKINQIRLLDKNTILIVNRLEAETSKSFVDEVALHLENGIKIILLKTENISAKELITVGKVIRELCSIYNSLFLVQSRIDIALLVHSDGVDLLKEDISPKDAKELLGENAIIGVHIEEETDIMSENVDYFISEQEIKNLEKPCYIRKRENNKIIYEKK